MQKRIDEINNIFRKIQIEYADCDKEVSNICNLKMYNFKKEISNLLNYILSMKYGH